MGAEDLILNGHNVAVVEYHINDVFETPLALARQNFYYVTGLPTVVFDGVIENSGGNNTTSLYETYLPLYEQRKDVLSDFTIDILGINSQLTDYVVNVSIEKVAENNASNLKLFFVLTESEIDYVWMGQPTVNYCQHFAFPEDDGSSLDFSQSDILDFSFPFSVDPEWNLEHCEVVVWIQNLSNKEVYQTAKRSLSEFGDYPERDILAKHLYTPVTICSNSFVPELEVENLGSVTLTSLDLVYQIDDEPAQSYNWSGDIASLESGLITLPEIATSISNFSIFSVYIENPNGEDDEFPYNDTIATIIESSEDVSSPITVVIKLDGTPEETSWEISNSTGDILYSGGNYTEPNVFVTESLSLPDADCYTFKIYDSEGNGLAGTGLYKLMSGSTIFQTGKNYGFYDEVQFEIGLVGFDPKSMINEVNIYPNPATNTINIKTYYNINHLSVFNNSGQKVYEIKARTNNLNVDVSDLEAGVYSLKIVTEKGTKAEHVVIQ